MDYIRKANDRGHANFGWLDSRHSFSFGHYYDPKHMGHSVLRVINDDHVSAGAGFDTHGHRDMEIITYVLEGSIKHKDSMGNEFELPAGEVQRMSAGTGVTHSEYNGSKTNPLHFLQIWILPDQRGIKPEYEQAHIEQSGKLTALVTPNGDGQSLRINQDASMYRLVLKSGEEYTLETEGRQGYLHVIEGHVEATSPAVNGGEVFARGDGVGMDMSQSMTLKAGDQGVHALWFDLPTVA